MHDGGDYYIPHRDGSLREGGFGKSRNQANTMPHTHYPPPPAPPCPPKPVKRETQSTMSDQQIRECFIEYMKQRYPRRELTYSYTFDRFVDSAIHEMFEAFCAGVVKRVMNKVPTEGNK